MSVRRQIANRERLRVLDAWRYYRRQILGRSARSVAELLGVSRSKVQRWESADSDELPDIGDIVALSKALHVDPVDMFAWIMRVRDFHEAGG